MRRNLKCVLEKKSEILSIVVVLLINCFERWINSQYNHSKQRRDDRDSQYNHSKQRRDDRE